MKHTVLVVDDQPSVREVIIDYLTNESYEVVGVGSAEEASAALSVKHFDVVLSDEMMPGMSGTELLATVCKEYPETVRLILTGHPTLETAIAAINEGQIYRFFTKPCNLFDLALTIRQALAQKALQEENRKLEVIVDEQAASIQSLEKEHPGITRVKRDAEGAVIID
jgi:two-component system, probable response regulator PhcQ